MSYLSVFADVTLAESGGYRCLLKTNEGEHEVKHTMVVPGEVLVYVIHYQFYLTRVYIHTRFTVIM